MKKFFKRPRVIIISLIVILLILLAVTTIYAPIRSKVTQLFFGTKVYALLNDNDVMGLHQVITKDSTNSRTIMWQSFNDDDNEAFILEYGLTTDDLQMTKPTKQVLDIDDKQIYVYTVQLNDLQANSTYNYRVGYEDKRTDWHTLQTSGSDTKDFKVLIFPDSQSNDYTDWKNLAMNAWQSNQDTAFFINMGDLVDNGYDLSQWNSWFDSTEDMINKIPVAPVQGNHETYTTDWKVAMPTPYLTLFNLPSINDEKHHNMYYSYDYGDVHFVVLNTQEDEMSDFVPDLLDAQMKWLEQDLSTTTKKWKIVLMHRDILNYGRDAKPLGDTITFTPQAKNFMPIFDKYNVDAVMTAHLHTYRRRTLLKNFQPDENGTLYILTGVAGNVRYPNLWHRNPLDDYMPPQPETDNYIVLNVSDDKLTFTSYYPDNTQMDTVTLQK